MTGIRLKPPAGKLVDGHEIRNHAFNRRFYGSLGRKVRSFLEYLRRGIHLAWLGIPALALEDIIGETADLSIVLRRLCSDRGAGSAWDVYCVAAVARVCNASVCFEIGAGYGRTTLNLAANTADEAVIYTLDLPSQALCANDRETILLG